MKTTRITFDNSGRFIQFYNASKEWAATYFLPTIMTYKTELGRCVEFNFICVSVGICFGRKK